MHDDSYACFQNTVSGYCQWQGQEMCDKLNSYVETNERWVNSMVEQNGATDPYWHQVRRTPPSVSLWSASTSRQNSRGAKHRHFRGPSGVCNPQHIVYSC